jgi:AraC-like DNA-binding protein
LMQNKECSPQGRALDLHTKEETQDISCDIVEELLEKLDRFARNKKYLNSSISLNKRAKERHTNPNYLSRVIILKMEKTFSQYLNDLRIRYAVNELKTNKIFRKYSTKAIAEECGFNSGGTFSRVFYNTTGLKPLYYIKNLEKNVGYWLSK